MIVLLLMRVMTRELYHSQSGSMASGLAANIAGSPEDINVLEFEK